MRGDTARGDAVREDTVRRGTVWEDTVRGGTVRGDTVRAGIALTLVALIASALPLGCGPGDVPEAPRGEPEMRGDAEIGGEVVSTVDGAPITLAEVQEQAAGAGSSPAEALRTLQDEALLAAEAARRGYGTGAAVRRAGEKALVQALLAEIEAEHPPESFSEQQVRDFFEAHAERFGRPERREAEHVLVRLPEGTAEGSAEDERARAVAAAIAGELARSPEAIARYRGLERLEGFELLTEAVPAVARGQGLDAGFEDPLFAAEAPGALPQPARTQYGWHAIVLKRIEPGVEPELAQAEALVREEMAKRARYGALVQLVGRLQEELGVDRREEAIEAALHAEWDLGS